MAKREEMVQVQIYIAGKGPKHKIKVPLQGWERKQIDLEGIMSKYRLRSIYAYSLTSGRGLQLLYNPRNGLSFVSYSGKPDAVIRIDGDPKVCISIRHWCSLVVFASYSALAVHPEEDLVPNYLQFLSETETNSGY